MSRIRLLLTIVLTGGLLILHASPSAGQDLGFVGGLNFTSADQVEFQDAQVTFENRTGYHLGIYANLGLGPLEVRPGIRYLDAGRLYDGLGTIFTSDEETVPAFDDEFNVSFVSVPIDAVLNLPAPLIDPYLYAGPEFRFQRTPDAPEAFEEALNDWTYIGNLGVGARISLPGSGITLVPEIRYSFGLNNWIAEDVEFAGQTFEATDQQRSDSFFISLGIEP